MRFLVVTLLLLMASCSDAEKPSAAPLYIKDADISLKAFNGTLFGKDRGEFIGYLAYQGPRGEVTTLLKENVHGLVRNQDGIFALTGLDHLGTNEGFLYKVSAQTDGGVEATQIGYLPGAPSDVTQHADGSISFLSLTGYLNDKRHYQCLSLMGKVASYSNDCDPPIPYGL